ncbi:hypothetical protein F4813DRAFT_358765 [Daldinia decipiens]|uniref:uncharacterized protein n=1 Tax=Daldinia decipiens TaxID=326647 RepID=UPI0020C24691|nr:uncharacterized protein F4813DRAFT_358765 [Daldinia decipiens]KAI1658006.1 hypothetical protein F4813DRAFT_358765 [Daldinia decipiens]
MSRRLFYSLSILISISALFLARFITLSPSPKSPPVVIGRANVVLFLVNSEAGLSNVFVAIAKSVLEQHPAVTIHFVSFAPLAPQLERISSYIRVKNPSNPAPDIRLSGRIMSNMVHRITLDFLAIWYMSTKRER